MKNKILAQITFGPYPEDADPTWYDQVEEAFQGFISNLTRCGQILGDGAHGIIQGKLTAFIELSTLDALDEKYLSKYARQSLMKLEALLGCTYEVKVLTPPEKAETSVNWQDAEWLVLYGASINGLAPLRNQECDCLPSYLLPIDADEMENLYFWARSQDRHESLWFASGSLEEETYIALADPGSRLNFGALELTQRLEKATGKPTYRYLFRHYALPDGDEETRPCPGCGKPWRVENEHFDFRCEPCRLISDIGPAQDENNWARIGTWLGN